MLQRELARQLQSEGSKKKAFKNSSNPDLAKTKSSKSAKAAARDSSSNSSATSSNSSDSSDSSEAKSTKKGTLILTI